MLAGQVSDIGPRFGSFCVSQSIIRIEPDRLIEVTDSFAMILEIPTLKMEMTLEVRVMRFHVRRRPSLSRIRSEQSYLQRLSDRPGDFLLNGEDIFQFAIERSRPELNSVRSVHEFSYDTYPVALLAHRSIQKGAHTQLFANRLRFLFPVFEAERRAATDDLEPANLRQSRDQFLGQTI